MSPLITAAVEGYPDEAVVQRLCEITNLQIETIHIKRGKGNLDKKLKGYNNAAKLSPWLVLRDLDHDADCAPELCERLLPDAIPNMHFRIAVREVEAWLMGDAGSCAQYFSIPKTKFPSGPETLEKPKEELIRIIKRYGSKDIIEEMVPLPGGIAKEGPAYASRVADFARNHWSPLAAAKVCDSLQRCLSRLQNIR